MKLPKEIDLKESMGAAISSADYISINIPYIKGEGEGGTHGIIGEEVISQFKSDAVLLNFARGELVDSEAMKEFLDRGDGRYVMYQISLMIFFGITRTLSSCLDRRS